MSNARTLGICLAATAMCAGVAAHAQHDEGGPITLTVAQDDEAGTYLADAEGIAVYLLTADRPDEDAEAQVTCEDLCLTAWPPLWTDSTPEAGEGVDASLIGTIEHKGRKIATYNGWPLYHYNLDDAPGEIDGHRVEEFGGIWFLLTPDGEKVPFIEVPDQQSG